MKDEPKSIVGENYRSFVDKDRALRHAPPSPDEVIYQSNYGHDQQYMNEKTRDMKQEKSQRPAGDEDDGDEDPHEFISPCLRCE